MEVPLVGCASHRFNLAVNLILASRKNVLDKVHHLMGKFKNLKFGAKLRKYTMLSPIQRNATRWSSTAEMVKRYFELKQFVMHFGNCAELLDFFPTPRENVELEELSETMKMLDSVTKALQGDVDLSDVRALFDEIISKIPETGHYLGQDANIVANPVFEKAIMKLQDDSPNELNEEEKQAVAYLFTVNFEAEDQQQSADTDTDFARSIIKKRKMTMPVKKYESCKFILPTSDLVERFFSSAGYALSDLRNRLLPSNLELQLFLKVNKRFWDKKTVQNAMNIE